jgi:uncharacterized membrane protein
MLKITIPYFTFKYDISFLLTKQSIIYNKIWRVAFYTHISSSIFILLFGSFQFINITNQKIKQIHRLLGKIYVILVLFISAPSGLIMAFYANGGWPAKLSFMVTSILWWCFTFFAYIKIKQNNIQKHKQNMYRSYALTLSAISLRIYVLLLPFIIHLSAKEMYALVAWLSWVPNLIIAEIIIKKKLNKIN